MENQPICIFDTYHANIPLSNYIYLYASCSILSYNTIAHQKAVVSTTNISNIPPANSNVGPSTASPMMIVEELVIVPVVGWQTH
jgi:hypothetical protein